MMPPFRQSEPGYCTYSSRFPSITCKRSMEEWSLTSVTGPVGSRASMASAFSSTMASARGRGVHSQAKHWGVNPKYPQCATRMQFSDSAISGNFVIFSGFSAAMPMRNGYRLLMMIGAFRDLYAMYFVISDIVSPSQIQRIPSSWNSMLYARQGVVSEKDDSFRQLMPTPPTFPSMAISSLMARYIFAVERKDRSVT